MEIQLLNFSIFSMKIQHIKSLICLNTATLMMKYYEMTPEYERMLLISNVVFTTMFSFEAFMKIYGFGPLNYFRDGWNKFDFVTVQGSLIDAALYFMNAVFDGMTFR